MKAKCWESKSGNCLTVTDAKFKPGENGIEDDAVLVYRLKGKDWNDIQQQHYTRQGWGLTNQCKRLWKVK